MSMTKHSMNISSLGTERCKFKIAKGKTKQTGRTQARPKRRHPTPDDAAKTPMGGRVGKQKQAERSTQADKQHPRCNGTPGLKPTEQVCNSRVKFAIPSFNCHSKFQTVINKFLCMQAIGKLIVWLRRTNLMQTRIIACDETTVVSSMTHPLSPL